MTAHWAAHLIGKPYQRGADGPDAFDCWGLVRYAFRTQHGIVLPVVSSMTDVRRTGWAPVEGEPRAWDVLVTSGPHGRHIGVVVAANGGLALLHAIERAGACVTPIEDLQVMGYSRPTLWRQKT